jgi:outer membrane protein
MSYQIRFSHVAVASLMAALLMVALLGTRVPPAAAADGTVKIAVVDMEKILTSSVMGKKAIAALKKEQETAEAQLNSRAREIKDMQAKFNDGRSSLPQDQLAQLEKQLEDKTVAHRRQQDDATRNLTKQRVDVLGSFDQKVMPVINQLGKEMGYTAVFRKDESGLIYTDDSIDVTAVVIQRLDAGQ